ncbi:MAG: hypothetical protein ACXV5Q_15430, partial [Frankiaceae bacterium]
AMSFRGARYIHIFVPCPLGWGASSNDTIKLARLVKETGLFPVFEAEHGEVTSVSKIRRHIPVEEYLRPQRRYAHLFGEHGHPETIQRVQALADRNIARYGLLDEMPESLKPPGSAVGRQVRWESEDLTEQTSAMAILTETTGAH